MTAYPVTDSMREWATAYVESCRYVAEQRGEPFDADKATARIRASLLAGPRYDGRDDSGFEAPGVDMGRSRDDDEQADRAAEREWAARWGR